MLKINPRLIYCSISAFGQDGPRRNQTAYDHVIQATSGIMASTGTEEVNPIKIGAPAVDYATGTMGAFALSAALFQRERTGKGQHIDLAMVGVAMMMQASLMTGYFRNCVEPRPHGNKQPYATNSAYDAKEGMVMIGASNIRQQARFWRAIGREDMIKTDNETRVEHREAEARVIAEIIKNKTADEWEVYFQSRHVPAARVRTMAEAIADPHIAGRSIFHHFDSAPGMDGGFGVPLAAFKFAHGGPSIEEAPHAMGADTDAVLGELGYDRAAIARLRQGRAI
jgi:crotonobetainyl-CoA:carnitine CoA-transferase CaiB-like acyl-CoA transferase